MQPGVDAAEEGPEEVLAPGLGLLGVAPVHVDQPQRALRARGLQAAYEVRDRRVPAAAAAERGDGDRDAQPLGAGRHRASRLERRGPVAQHVEQSLGDEHAERPGRAAPTDQPTQPGTHAAAIVARPVRRLETRLDGPVLIAPNVFQDERGFFSETFRASVLAELGIDEPFVQDNHSRSSRGTVRGMHFQIGEGASKLVRCGRGTIVDVLVDIRRGSPQYGRWEAFELSDSNMHVLYAPIGFAHGFCVVSEVADVLYKQSGYYSEDVERGFRFDDPDVGIEWPVAREELIFSPRDATAPLLREIAADLPFRVGG